MKKIDPQNFDPEVLEESLSEFTDSRHYLPVNIQTQVDYSIWGEKLLLTTGSLIWGFEDIAPFYFRLRKYLAHWRYKIQAQIDEVRVESDQFDEVVIASSDLKDWDPADALLMN